MGVPFDLKNLMVTGVPAPVLDNVQTNDTGSMSYALSQEGTIAYATGWDVNLQQSVLNVDLSGNATEFFEQKGDFEFARYSPDGKYAALVIRDTNNQANIWIYHMEGGALNQLTFYKIRALNRFAWSPDSKAIAYGTQAEDSTNSIYIKNIDGTGTAEKIYTSPLDAVMGVKDWSADGDKISFDQRAEASNFDMFVYSFRDNNAKPYASSPAFEVEPNFSPNGKWVVYQAGTPRTEVYVRPFPDSSGGLWKISNDGGDKPVWSPDGQKIYYQNGNAMYAVDVTATEVFSKGNPQKIFEGNYFLPRGRRFDIHPDGDKFIMIQRAEVPPEEQKIFVIQNFSEELKRLVPVGKD
jgi:Tol biopolymer transport system component